MAYALNSSISTRKLYLSSTGHYYGDIDNPTFQLQNQIQLNPKTLHILGVENITFMHPTYFHENYMGGIITHHINGAETETPITTDFFDTYLKGLYVSQSSITPSVVDAVLYNMLYALKGMVSETDTIKIILKFEGYETDEFIYNKFAKSNANFKLLDWDAVTAGGYAEGSGITDDIVTKHKALIYSLMTRRFKFQIGNNMLTDLKIKGPFASMLGLSPNVEHYIAGKLLTVMPATYKVHTLTCKLPLFGHDYIAVSSNIASNSHAAMNGEKLSSADVLSIIPTSNYPGNTESFSPASAGGRVEINYDTVDSIELRFEDENGDALLSLENFIVTLSIDEVITAELPEDDRVRLDLVRNGQMEQLRKKLRTQLS